MSSATDRQKGYKPITSHFLWEAIQLQHYLYNSYYILIIDGLNKREVKTLTPEKTIMMEISRSTQVENVMHEPDYPPLNTSILKCSNSRWSSSSHTFIFLECPDNESPEVSPQDPYNWQYFWNWCPQRWCKFSNIGAFYIKVGHIKDELFDFLFQLLLLALKAKPFTTLTFQWSSCDGALAVFRVEAQILNQHPRMFTHTVGVLCSIKALQQAANTPKKGNDHCLDLLPKWQRLVNQKEALVRTSQNWLGTQG